MKTLALVVAAAVALSALPTSAFAWGTSGDGCGCYEQPHKRPKGNNGVGNGVDPQPPGNPPINDAEGTGPGNPGNQGGGH